jgi:hypothetical protein
MGDAFDPGGVQVEATTSQKRLEMIVNNKNSKNVAKNVADDGNDDDDAEELNPFTVSKPGQGKKFLGHEQRLEPVVFTINILQSSYDDYHE